ncbi:tyrosine-type recombinase/integrase [Noviherbaspirillum aridicola]|uniref:Integrase n=1 Tax=Noviherbaspirillum aridicola TaxID=2849687 RepID=A0ABQ4PYV9_9BURK|nr:tyrosine-type recombinase/integrase [Noviherbaspirillum aridicola]GIZ50085.1 integrase [Noviherbaspirillum aridicola]
MSRQTPISLFDSPDTWLNAPKEAFASWVVSDRFATTRRGDPQVLRDSSIKVYRAMFGKFADQVLGTTSEGRPEKSLREVGVDDIRRFLDANRLNKGIRHRYVRLLERTFDLLLGKGLVDSNPARGLAVAQPTRSGKGNDRTQWLSAEQQAAVLAALPQGEGWKDQRSRAMIATVLAGGLKVSEVIRLSLSNVGMKQEDGSVFIDVYPGGAGRWHRTRVAAFGAGMLLQWVALRKSLQLPGNLLFPAGPTGAVLHPATVYRQVKAVLAAAGVPEEQIKRRGARTLRNSFALRELEDGASPALVGEYLGHRADRSTRYYTELLPRGRGRARPTGD